MKVSRPDVKVRARRGYLALPSAALLMPRPVTLESRSGLRPDLPEVPYRPDSSLCPTAALSPLSGSEAGPSLGPRSAPVDARTPAVRARIDAGRVALALGKPAGDADAGEAAQGWSAYEKGDVETAARHLGEAAKAPDARPWVVYALGLSHFALRRFADAADAWERVRREVPEFEPIYFSLADAYGLQHEEGTALKVLREAERRWPDDAEVANAVGVIHICRGALDAAIGSSSARQRSRPEMGSDTSTWRAAPDAAAQVTALRSANAEMDRRR